MKKLFYLFGLILAIGFVACNNDDVSNDQQANEVQVSVNTTVVRTGTSSDDFTKATDQEYDRNGAPVQVSGIKITVENTKLDWYPDVTEEFPFSDSDDAGNPITMTIGVGTNLFTAVSTTDITAGTWVEQYFSDKEVTGTLSEKAALYSDALETSHPIYVEYATEYAVWRNVQFNTDWYEALVNPTDPNATAYTHDQIFASVDDNDPTTPIVKMANSWPGFVNLSLTSQLGRTSIVFETEVDLQYRITPTLYKYVDGTNDSSLESKELLHSGTTKASAVVFNGTNVEDGTYILVKVEKSSNGTDWETVTESIQVNNTVGANTTHVINFDGTQTNDVGISVTFSDFSTDNSQNSDITEDNESTLNQ